MPELFDVTILGSDDKSNGFPSLVQLKLRNERNVIVGSILIINQSGGKRVLSKLKRKSQFKGRELDGRVTTVLLCLVLPPGHISPSTHSAFGQLAVTESTELGARTVTGREWLCDLLFC